MKREAREDIQVFGEDALPSDYPMRSFNFNKRNKMKTPHSLNNTDGQVDTKPPLAFELEKNDLARIRVSRTTFKGHEFIDVRTFVKNDLGDFIPTQKGVTIAPEQLPTFISGLQRIQSEGVK